MISKYLLSLSVFLLTLCMSVNTHAQTLLEYQKQRQEEVAKQKRLNQEKEKKAFEEACANGITALNRFILEHPRSMYLSEAQKRIEDYTEWDKAQKLNTKEAYQSYLRESKLLSYQAEAQKAIRVLNAEEAWRNCQNSEDWVVIQRFIGDYPDFPHMNEAKYKLNLLKGEWVYSIKSYESAYTYLTQADAFRPLTGLPAEHLRQLKDQPQFKEIIKSSDISKVTSYLMSLDPDSPFYIPTSNHLALLKGDALNGYSSDYSMEEALSYANDAETREKIQAKIKGAKAYRAYYKRQKRNNWWEHRFMVGWNVVHWDYMSEIMTAGTGLRFRLGRWDDTFNFIFGAEYSFIWTADSDSENKTIGQRMSIPVIVRLNLYELGTDTELYIGCGGDFGFKLKDGNYSTRYLFPMNKNSIAVEPQLGLTGVHWDLGVYYKRYLDDYIISPIVGNQTIGCFLTWYF